MRIFTIALVALSLAAQTGTRVDWSQIKNAPIINVRQYNFAAQAPGGSLIIGNNTITMRPVPAGVNGNDTSHYLYVSGGTGTAEACLITGGSGRAGDASGQIIIQCSNTHSGAWTVATATGGIQEAWTANGSGWTYILPNQIIDLWATPVISLSSGQAAIFQGSSYGMTGFSGGTTLVSHASGANSAFYVSGIQGLYSGQLSLRDFRINANGVAANVLKCDFCQLLETDNLILEGAGAVNGNGLVCSGCVFATVRRSQFINNKGTGAVFVQAGTGGGVYTFEADRFLDNCQNSGGAACANLFINGAYTVDIGGTSFEGANSLTSGGSTTDGGFGVRLQNVFGFSIHGSYAERNRSGAVGIFNARGFDISGNNFLDSGVYVDATASNGSIHGNSLEAADTVPVNVSSVVSNGGFCQITTSAAHNLAVFSTVYLTGIGGATACNGPAMVESTQSVTVYTTNRPFGGAYTSGGTSQAMPGMVVPPNIDVRVSALDLYGSPGPAAFYISGTDLLHGIGPSIASATTIAPTYETQHITGTAAIVSITPPTTFASGFQGAFCAIPDGAFTTTNAGNIAIASAAVVNKTLCFTYDPTTAKWTPSY